MEPYSQATAKKALDGCAHKSKAQDLAILISATAKSVHLEGGIDCLQQATRREFAARPRTPKQAIGRNVPNKTMFFFFFFGFSGSPITL